MKYACLCIALLLAPASLLADDHQVFAHRGASGYLPEHSLPSKAMAYAQGADFLEQDVVLTKDDVPLVLHDIHLEGITDVATRFPDRKRADGSYYAIDFTLAEIKQLSATQRYNPKTGKPVYAERFPLDGYTYQLHTLEEEIRFIQGLNASTGRNVGLFTEIKQPTFHTKEGHDVAKAVFEVLSRHGYGAEKDSAIWVQCFEQTTLRRFREEFGWKGRLMMIFSGSKIGADGSDYDALATPEGLKSLAKFVDGVFPNLPRVVTWDKNGAPHSGDFTKLAHAASLRVVSGVVRRDDLPPNCPSIAALHEGLFDVAGVDDVCTDFPDLSVDWLNTTPPPVSFDSR
ncbi:glycerophosphodiester phosphodiesterase [Blastopirellula sp. JC732]|uniref:glycerophosphodiester phosphodiesterase n=1 Tax=Blastopirellula sediminis TaxID=2894196 RepID=A0A9X1MS64_9BACT|nr:glycerophosphodiester phosphodiesterase [Blastopirellula sediminis]MCC9604820.1 glycerophosphodiester phosphodiesterase [Blastopirellula sediminis]MCC9631881.1 glycerophosphodiester phosphodiesterase [Blastopirellula sediminis]